MHNEHEQLLENRVSLPLCFVAKHEFNSILPPTRPVWTVADVNVSYSI